MEESDPMKLSFYELDGKRYFICDGEVYTNDETGARVRVDMLPSSLQMYAECTDDPLFELKIIEIKELNQTTALINCEDGSGLEFSFLDKEFDKYKNRYKTGEKGIYQIQAELESVEVPDNHEDGVELTGEAAKEFFEWVEDEVEPDAAACVGFYDMGLYEKLPDFSETGRYSFYGIVDRPSCYSVSEEIDEPDPEKNSGFKIPLMNQFKKEDPRFIDAHFVYPEYHKGVIEEGWAVKAVLRLIARHGITNNVYEYGSNRTVCPEEKGLFGHEDDEYFEDEDGNRWLEDDDDFDFEDEED